MSVEIALLKEQLAERDATIAESDATIADLRTRVDKSTNIASTSAPSTSSEFIKRNVHFEEAHLGRDDEEDREAELVAALPSFDSTY